MIPSHEVPTDLFPLLESPFDAQMAFSYPRESWSRWLGHLGQLGPFIDDLPAALDRPTVTELVAMHAQKDPVSAFVPAMIWGHGNSGYGPYRVARVLTQSSTPLESQVDQSVLRKLADGYRVAAAEGPIAGYYRMNNEAYIKHLGPAFFTKWLHFSTAATATDPAGVAPILDRLVLDWLHDHDITIRAGRTPGYENYVSLLSSWGKPHNLGPAQVEERIFRLIRDAQEAERNTEAL
ncbi:hypothetical protein ABZX73_13085 [Brevibacterium casei]